MVMPMGRFAPPITLFKRLSYIELIASAIYLLYFGVFNATSVYQCLFFGVALACLGAFVTSVVVQKRQLFDAVSVILLAISIGLLAFNYLPSVSLWLLLFYRLMVTPKKNSVSLVLLAIVIIGFTFFTNYTYSLTPTLDSLSQNRLNHLCLLITAVFFGFYLWQLLLKIQELQLESVNSQEQMANLVEMTSKLSRFVPVQISQPIIRHNQPLTATNQRKKLTILFSDIVGFTELSDNLSPDHLADILNTYFGHMTAIAQQYGATLDKFIGDGMLCFFGDTPHSDEKSDAIKCASMALAMRQAMQTLRSQWRLLGFEGLYIRIGINTGYCHVGNFGSSERLSYTLIGKAANLASRLEAAAEKDQILVSESTYQLISTQHSCELVGHYHLKGLSEPIPVWQLLENTQTIAPLTDFHYTKNGFRLDMDLQGITAQDVDSIRHALTMSLEYLEKNTEKS